MMTFNKAKPKYSGLYLTIGEGKGSNFELNYIYKCDGEWFIADYPNYWVTKPLDYELSKLLLFKNVELSRKK